MQLIFSTFCVLTLTLGIFQCAKAPEVVNVSTSKDTAATVQQSSHDEHADDDAARISLAEAKAAFDAGTAVFVDSRSAGSYNIEHVKGAINVPFEAVEANYKKVPQGKKIIVYCS